ncbi:Nicotinamidase [Nitrospira tepida]|uniref:nicotinamidase n=1 Tax=Nitrospira tepida TaxID=2973512 RepID=A0AA86TBC2_9BACT|nr:isochorismatase family protein [Nitrospira tepida]CAI4033858.1 Nicotinamidase [Nitrospira tepida]
MIALTAGDALLIADIQNDFLPGGALGITGGDRILPALHRYMERFQAKGLPIWLSRDWHPSDHCSFKERGGPWPVHCVADTAGALPPPSFHPPSQAFTIYKATARDREAYSAFQETSLDRELRAQGVRRLFIGGLATDYCVLNSVKDGLRLGYTVHLLMDGICAVNASPTDGKQAEDEMIRLGARPTRLEDLAS